MSTRAISVTVPGDKSISHRALMIASLARGRSAIDGLPEAGDVRSTAAALAALGVGVNWPEGTGRATVAPPSAWPTTPVSLDCGNSGT
ncbi:MAG: 3-phosphoshikimate 1-carboxyvinyltransferase, partial [Gemmatimonadota bacterium]